MLNCWRFTLLKRILHLNPWNLAISTTQPTPPRSTPPPPPRSHLHPSSLASHAMVVERVALEVCQVLERPCSDARRLLDHRHWSPRLPQRALGTNLGNQPQWRKLANIVPCAIQATSNMISYHNYIEFPQNNPFSILDVTQPLQQLMDQGIHLAHRQHPLQHRDLSPLHCGMGLRRPMIPENCEMCLSPKFTTVICFIDSMCYCNASKWASCPTKQWYCWIRYMFTMLPKKCSEMVVDHQSLVISWAHFQKQTWVPTSKGSWWLGIFWNNKLMQDADGEIFWGQGHVSPYRLCRELLAHNDTDSQHKHWGSNMYESVIHMPAWNPWCCLQGKTQ